MITLYFNLAKFSTFIAFNRSLLESLQIDSGFFVKCTMVALNQVNGQPDLQKLKVILDQRLDLYQTIRDRFDDYYFNNHGFPSPLHELTNVYETIIYGIMALQLDVLHYLNTYRLFNKTILNLDIKGNHGEIVI